MTKFAYNNVKNTNTSYNFFKFYYNYYLHIFFKKNINPYFKFFIVDTLANVLKDLIIICQQRLLHI